MTEQDLLEAQDGEPARLSDTVLCVRYNGKSDWRTLTRRDLSGDPGESTTDTLNWTPDSEMDWALWLGYAGSRERAMEVLQAHSHEFELVGPGANELSSEFEEEEFEIGGLVP